MMRFLNWLRRLFFGRPDIPAPAGVILLDQIGLFLRQTAARGWADPDEFRRVWDAAPGFIEFLILRMPDVRNHHPTQGRRKRYLWTLAKTEQLTATMFGQAFGDDTDTVLRELKSVFVSAGLGAAAGLDADH